MAKKQRFFAWFIVVNVEFFQISLTNRTGFCIIDVVNKLNRLRLAFAKMHRPETRKVIRMTYHELVKKVQTALAKADATKVEEHIAIQVNVTGDAEGAFYMEISGGVLYVAAYDYNDRDALLTADGADVLAVAQGKISLQEAISSGKIAHEGDYGKTLMLGDTIPQKKTAAKKAEAAPAVTETAAPAEKPKRGRKPAAKKAEAPAAAQTAAPAEKPKRGRKPGSKKTTK